MRRRWKDFLLPAAMVLVLVGCLALPSSSPPMLQGIFVGICIGFLAALVVGVTLLIDGSLLRRLGLGVAEDVGDELRRTRGVHGVISNLMFAGTDVDHIVLAPAGVFVMEVKWSLRPTADLQHVWGLPAYLAQTRAAARKVRGLLRATAPEVPVLEVLVLCGPGAPRLDAPVDVDGVVVINAMTRQLWASFLADGREPVLALSQAREVAVVLEELRDKRIAYELTSSEAARARPRPRLGRGQALGKEPGKA